MIKTKITINPKTRKCYCKENVIKVGSVYRKKKCLFCYVKEVEKKRREVIKNE